MNVVDVGGGSVDAAQVLSDMFADGWGTNYLRTLSNSRSITYGSSYTFTYLASAISNMADPANGAKDLFVLYPSGFDFFAWLPIPESPNVEAEGKIICFFYSTWQNYPLISPDEFRITLNRESNNNLKITLYNNAPSASYVTWFYEYVTMWTQKNPPVTNQSTRSLGGGHKGHPYIIHISCQFPPSKEVRLLANSIDVGAEIVEQVIVQTPFATGSFTGTDSSSVTISAARGFENIVVYTNQATTPDSSDVTYFMWLNNDPNIMYRYWEYYFQNRVSKQPCVSNYGGNGWIPSSGNLRAYYETGRLSREGHFASNITYNFIAWNDEGGHKPYRVSLTLTSRKRGERIGYQCGYRL